MAKKKYLRRLYDKVNPPEVNPAQALCSAADEKQQQTKFEGKAAEPAVHDHNIVPSTGLVMQPNSEDTLPSSDKGSEEKQTESEEKPADQRPKVTNYVLDERRGEPGVRVSGAGSDQVNGWYKKVEGGMPDAVAEKEVTLENWVKLTEFRPWYSKDDGSFICYDYSKGWVCHDAECNSYYMTKINSDAKLLPGGEWTTTGKCSNQECRDKDRIDASDPDHPRKTPDARPTSNSENEELICDQCTLKWLPTGVAPYPTFLQFG